MAELADLNTRIEGLSDYCQKALAPQVAAVDLANKVDPSALKKALLHFGPVAVVGFILLQMGKAQTHPGLMKSAVMVIGLIAIAVGGIFILKELVKVLGQYSKRAAAMRKLAGEIKQLLVRFLDPSFTLEPYCAFPTKVYDAAGLFPSSYDRSSAQDRFVGTLGKTRFEAMKIATYRKVESKDSKGNTRTTYVPLFTGMLFQAEFNKNFASHTTVRTDSSEKFLGGLARTAQRFTSALSKRTLVELENPVFEAAFQVHSTNAIEARYILTPSFMERILALKQKRGEGIQIAFQNSSVIVGIPNSPERYNKSFDLTNLNASAEGLMTELFDVLALVDELDLNNRLAKAA